ncbi:high affinity nerve growth factor receptor-like [Notothenia coriiceps]|uniref:High affinity nerve growth factor receptor-like n=1 Tax=Notothenia coriiceps TaxID=8208 RepID=A0A6I9NHC9_9TELE|nr:PREDICTED: high affinity nerve growth factor receptor-like [Notothenia coriiceps]
MAVAPYALALPLVFALLSLAPAPALGGCPAACRCSFAMLQCLEPNGITSIPALATQESENVTEIYIENQDALENITEIDLAYYRELKNLTVTSCKLRLISINAFQFNLKLQYVNLASNSLEHISWRVFHFLPLLNLAYDTIKGEELMESVRIVQAAQGERQYGEAWRVINEMTGRKRSKEGQVEGHSPKERVTTWFNHFQSLLGTIADGAEESIPAFLQNLPIDDGPFTVSLPGRSPQ